jgi:hypothetical protein
MFKNWIWPIIVGLFKFVFAVATLVGVWAASGVYHRNTYRADADAQMRIRVKKECLRPDYVTSLVAAREYDMQEREVDLVNEKVKWLSRRADELLEKREQTEALRMELVQGKVKKAAGIGGPAPQPKK